ncbi:MAG: hypothetical protein QF492_03520 [Candidatus Krumholzibacteria bacterium]|jgi:hypothetical protein|nr:hypothetical protein [Candidatus Krumholzibacteria bacterium]MDP6668967.1 hypothetical protein [Candidatus Krumholzibacteria bacterium]MDP6797102.1 hypothetical protein [Candidatus Krumholzibacteria bacterium]MDP7022445.1 hypothetical protein [Candidatus Krumholzibacteria bacterium]
MPKAMILVLSLLLAIASFAEVVHLKDGSSLEGSILSMDDENLVLDTSFAGVLTLKIENIANIDFAKGSDKPGGKTSKPSPVAGETGFLEVSVKGDAARSSVRYRWPSDRKDMLRLNTLHMRVFVDGELLWHDKDPEMNKEFRHGKWFILRNRHLFPPTTLTVPTGNHRVHVVIGNDAGLYEDAGNQQIASAEAIIESEDLEIFPGQTTRVVLKGKSARVAYGKYELEVLSTR